MTVGPPGELVDTSSTWCPRSKANGADLSIGSTPCGSTPHDAADLEFEAWGNIEEADGAFCEGTAWVEIDGGFGPFGLLGVGLAAAGGGMLVRAGVEKPR